MGLRSLTSWDCGFEPCPRAWMCVCCQYCVLSGRGLCDELVTHWCVVVCGLGTSRMRKPWSALGRSATGGGEDLPRTPDIWTSRRGCRIYSSVFIRTLVLIASLLRVIWVDLDFVLYLYGKKIIIIYCLIR
jgi:hypothetical protein